MRTTFARLAALILTAGVALCAAETSELSLSPDGRMHLAGEAGEICSFSPTTADAKWKFASSTAVGTPGPDAPLDFALKLGGAVINGAAQAQLQARTDGGAATLRWSFTATTETAFNCLGIASDFPLAALVGGSWEIDGARGAFPANFGETQLVSVAGRAVTITLADGGRFTLTFPTPTLVMLQDNRRWGGQSFAMRIGKGAGTLVAGAPYVIEALLTVPGSLRCRRDLPVLLAADADWVPLATELDIVPGSALDLSGLGLTSGPCGAHGRVIATPDGHFAFADEPGKPQRFYGVNLCFSAQYLPKDEADRLLDRLVRLGYNTVRIHHYEFALTTPEWSPGFTWDAAKVDQLDYLMAGCAKRGLWLTTDLYVSRPVPGKQLGLSGDRPEPDRFKLLVPVYEPAFQDWATFTRKFLDRVNPYTGKRVAEDPALAWISLINEGPNTGDAVKGIPEWKVAWNRWLAGRFATRAALAAAVGDLAANEDAAAGSVAFPDKIKSDGQRARLCQAFLADTERAMVERMRTLLRDELKCQALLTDINCCGPTPVPMQAARAAFDYVDDHFYVDHPAFLDKQWNLPSRCPNTNPLREGAPGGTSSASLRLWGKPFTVSEFDYSGPGRFRGVGGILTGALAALQDWDAVWRFAYAHKAKDLFTPAPIDYFNLVNDPLNQAADRAAVLLYLRRDLASAPQRLAVALPGAVLNDPPAGLSLGGIQSFAWTTRIGCAVFGSGQQPPTDAIVVPFAAAGDRAAVATLLRDHRLPVAAADGVIRSATGELTISPKQGLLTIDTPRTAGGYADVGQSISSPGAGVRIDGFTSGATVFVSSLGMAPIRSAPRLLVTHLTDLQNTGINYAESARQTLLAWGGLPHLVHDGGATVHIALADPAGYQVWALATSGRRLEQVKATIGADGLSFAVRVRGADGARMLYEVVRP